MIENLRYLLSADFFLYKNNSFHFVVTLISFFFINFAPEQKCGVG